MPRTFATSCLGMPTMQKSGWIGLTLSQYKASPDCTIVQVLDTVYFLVALKTIFSMELPLDVPDAINKFNLASVSGACLTYSLAVNFMFHSRPGESKEILETSQSNKTSSQKESSFMPWVNPNNVSKYIIFAGFKSSVLSSLKLNLRYSVKAFPTDTPCWWDIYLILVSPHLTTKAFSLSVSKQNHMSNALAWSSDPQLNTLGKRSLVLKVPRVGISPSTGYGICQSILVYRSLIVVCGLPTQSYCMLLGIQPTGDQSVS